MATMRAAAPPIPTIFRFASQPASTRRCAHCLRAQRCPFSASSRMTRPSPSKRPLMTESAQRPPTLTPGMPPPPRNAGVPETSVAGNTPTPGSAPSWPPASPWQRTDSGAGVAEREGEAQKSKPTTAGAKQQTSRTPSNNAATTATTTTTTAAPSPAPSPAPKKSRLRPRKAPITLTPKAVHHLKRLFEQPQSKLIRVGVKNRGCSGLAYHLEYVDKPGAFDETVEQDGVRVLIDSKALFSIIGSEMDWLEDKLSARFIFRNPNITEQCGCGESFSIS